MKIFKILISFPSALFFVLSLGLFNISCHDGQAATQWQGSGGTSRVDDYAPRDEQTAQDSTSQQSLPIKKKISRTDPAGVLKIDITYPIFGIKNIDVDIERWSKEIADNFYMANMRRQDGDDSDKWELLGDFTFSQPSTNAISIVSEIFTYLGGAHGLTDFVSHNYDVNSGKKLNIKDIFQYPDTAIKLMSTWCIKVLTKRLSDEGWDDMKMLQEGAAPNLNNFSCVSLTPEGISIIFQQYQVAPYAAGYQRVEMPLNELSSAQPVMRLWGK
jgi:hypothetical protein